MQKPAITSLVAKLLENGCEKEKSSDRCKNWAEWGAYNALMGDKGALVILKDLALQAQALADLIVYVWLVSLAIALVIGRKVNSLGVTFRALPGFWSPPLASAIKPKTGAVENAESFLLMGGLLLLRGTRDLVIVTLVALLVDCLAGCIFPRTAKHFTSNNILFSYLGFLLLRGYFDPGIIAILVTILVGFLCSRMLWGMIPRSDDPLWKVHFVSFVGGALTARFLDNLTMHLPTSHLW